MPVSNSVEADFAKALDLWADYERQHDVTDRRGHTAGIEPTSGKIWIGESMEDVVAQRNAEGCEKPLYFVRIGFPTYYRKGGRR